MEFIKTIEIEYEVNGEFEYVTVDFRVEASYGDLGIGSYEYWGSREVDTRMGWEVEDITWDLSKYTEEENRIIENYLNEHEEEITNIDFDL